MIDRRSLIAGGAAAAMAAGLAPRLAWAVAAPTSKRLVFIIQRGGADGMHILAPVGDPAYAGQRGVLAEDFADLPRLDSLFAMHPDLKNIGALYRTKQALFAHALASPYRDRSHFDAQNVLESGGTSAYQLKDGWLNRMIGLLPREEARALAIATAVPLALRGANEATSYAPSALPDASSALLERVGMLYEGDRQLHGLWGEAMRTRELTGDLDERSTRNAAATGALAARLLVPANGARVLMIETGGWDSHIHQRRQVQTAVRNLDAMVGALRDGLGPAWADTLVVVATEFGRTVKVNGTQGTDHGTGTVAMLIGGAVNNGGRVVADWPGLADSALYEARDLRPTIGLDAVLGSAVCGHYGLYPDRALAALFPQVKKSQFIGDLIRV